MPLLVLCECISTFFSIPRGDRRQRDVERLVCFCLPSSCCFQLQPDLRTPSFESVARHSPSSSLRPLSSPVKKAVEREDRPGRYLPLSDLSPPFFFLVARQPLVWADGDRYFEHGT